MKQLAKYMSYSWWRLILLVALVFVQVYATLRLPFYTAAIVDQGILQQDIPLIIHTGVMMLGMTLLAATIAISVGYLASKIATGFTRDVRLALFTQIENFSLADFDKFSTASLITRSTNDLQQIQQTLTQILRMMLIAPIMAIGALFSALQTAPELAWVIALGVSIIMSVIIILFAFGLPKFKLMQQLLDQLNLVARQNLTGLRVIRAFNKEKHQQAIFDQANKELTDVNLFTNRLMIILSPIMMLVMSLSSVTIVWFGAHLITNEQLEIGDMMAFMQYAIQSISSFVMISMLFILVPRAVVSAKRVGEVLSTTPSIRSSKNAKKLPDNPAGKVQFENVSFYYPLATEPALKNISFIAHPGQTTAIIGGTGSGKTSLIKLILRFYDVTKGEVLVDDISVKDINLKNLRQHISYVPQKASLFSGSISDTVKYGKSTIAKEGLAKAIKTAQANNFVQKYDKKTEHQISQGGANLSGGQKQRLSIARALAKDSQIIILDDSFSALDLKTDKKIRQAIASTTKDKTLIVVSQRISSIADADQILVLNDDGTLAGAGTHHQLYRTNGVYQEIAQSQLSDEELENLAENSSGDKS